MVTNGKHIFTFYVDGEQVAFVSVHPSQKDRFQMLLTRLCRYAAKFNYNVQFECKEESEEM